MIALHMVPGSASVWLVQHTSGSSLLHVNCHFPAQLLPLAASAAPDDTCCCCHLPAACSRPLLGSPFSSLAAVCGSHGGPRAPDSDAVLGSKGGGDDAGGGRVSKAKEESSISTPSTVLCGGSGGGHECPISAWSYPTAPSSSELLVLMFPCRLVCFNWGVMYFYSRPEGVFIIP